jgi:hypothetical protein
VTRYYPEGTGAILDQALVILVKGSHSFNVRLTLPIPNPQEFSHEEYQVSQLRFRFVGQLTVM